MKDICFLSYSRMSVLCFVVLKIISLTVFSVWSFDNLPQDAPTTVPVIRNLRVNGTEPKLMIEWDVVYNPNPAPPVQWNYVLTISEDLYTLKFLTTEKMFIFENSTYCSTYNITVYPLLSHGNVRGAPANTTVTMEVPALEEVTDIKVWNVVPDEAVLRWSYPSDIKQCVSTYSVSWSNGGNFTRDFTFEPFYVMSHLLPCEQYNVNVTPIAINGIEGKSQVININTQYVVPTAIEDVEILEYTYGLSIMWNLPRFGENCISQFLVSLCEKNSRNCLHDVVKHKKGDKRVMYYTTNTQACQAYSIRIVPLAGLRNGTSYSDQYTARPKAFDKPERVAVKSLSARSVVMTMPFRRYKNACDLLSVVVRCYKLGFRNPYFEKILPPDMNKDTVSVNVTDLVPYAKYSCAVAHKNIGSTSVPSDPVNFQTAEDVPSEPANLTLIELNEHGFIVNWSEPVTKNGNLQKYRISVISHDVEYSIPQEQCVVNKTENVTVDVSSNITSYTASHLKPYEGFTIQILASTSAGFGNNYAQLRSRTDAAESDEVRDLTVEQTNVTDYLISWRRPCTTNGKLKHFAVDVAGQRKGYKNHVLHKTVPIEFEEVDILYSIELKDMFPEYRYVVHVRAIIHDVEYGRASNTSFLVPATIPPPPSINKTSSHVRIDRDAAIVESGIKVNFGKELFDSINGDVLYYSILVYRNPFHNMRESGLIDTIHEWPHIENWANASKFDFIQPYQSTPIRWTPFEDRNETSYILGANDSCSSDEKREYCNGPLKSNTEFYLKIRAFTKGGYQETPPVPFSTGADDERWVTVSIIVVLVVAGVAIGTSFYVRSNSLKLLYGIHVKAAKRDNLPKPIPVKQFAAYCRGFVDSEKLRTEFQLLKLVSEKIQLPTSVANMSENSYKNKYTNILPYDQTRVVIENGTKTGYINASFIEGFNGSRKYIACQGPIRSTCEDFWLMILQNDVTVIVMLCNFIENEKVKCFNYYPDMNETSTHGTLKINCMAIENHPTFVLRRIVILKDNRRKEVYHVHFEEWPDFGVPDEPDFLINLNAYVRRLSNGKLIAVHCSAGVGRTGTYLAYDMSVDHVKTKKHISVFDIILKLRKQRMCMVQSESQYRYLYKCIAAYLANQT